MLALPWLYASHLKRSVNLIFHALKAEMSIHAGFGWSSILLFAKLLVISATPPSPARIAQKVTLLLSSAGGCERSWSSYGFTHSKKRNRLHPGRCSRIGRHGRVSP